MAENNKGLQFERFVQEIYRGVGCRDVRHNNLYYPEFDPERKKALQIDLTYLPRFGIRRRFVECKYTSDPAYSDFKEVLYFVSKLQLLGISPKRGDFVCNKPVSGDIAILSDYQGFRLVDNEQLLELWKKGRRFLGVFSLPFRSNFQSLEKLIARPV